MPHGDKAFWTPWLNISERIVLPLKWLMIPFLVKKIHAHPEAATCDDLAVVRLAAETEKLVVGEAITTRIWGKELFGDDAAQYIFVLILPCREVTIPCQ